MTIGARIKELRLKNNMMQVDLAKAVNSSKQTIYKYENDIVTNIPYDKIILLAKALNTTTAYLMGWEDEIPAYPGIMPVEKKRFPFLGEIACGEPIYADEEHNVWLESDSSIKADFCLRCKGDSMTGDNINDGDMVFIRKQDTVNNGDIACVIIDDEATLKHIYLADNTVSLVSSNLSYPPIIYKEDDCKTIKILGKAVALSRIL